MLFSVSGILYGVIFIDKLVSRQVNAAQWKDTGDIYFLIVMKPKDESKKEVTPCTVEAADAKWMTRFDYYLSSYTKRYYFFRTVMT